MGKIYHYTTIETLALILEHKTMRFNRLDKVDDMEEAMYGSGNHRVLLGQYCFVSCWTKDNKENIALWNMYTNNRGIRIAMDEDMFIKYKLSEKYYSYFKDYEHIECDCNFIFPNNQVKLHKIKYVEDNKSEISNLINSNGEWININTQDLGLIKNKLWRFQNECRFKLIALPRDSNLIKKIKNPNPVEISCSQIQSIFQNYKPCLEYIDIPINENALNSIEVMLGPETTLADKIIVESLLREFTNSSIRNSYFIDKMRRKNNIL